MEDIVSAIVMYVIALLLGNAQIKKVNFWG